MDWTWDGLPRPSGRTVKLRVGKAQEKLLRQGHPWLFDGGIRECEPGGALGDLGVVYDSKNRFLALGLYDPESPIRLRVMQRGRPASIDRAWLAERLRRAAARREPIRSSGTDGYRLVHGENDGLPAVVIDRYAMTYVLKLYSLAMISRLEMLVGALRDVERPERVVLRLSRNIQSRKEELAGLSDGIVLHGDTPEEPVQFTESGLTFEADVLRGQKTGFFLDQRENRLRAGELAPGRSVLNVFSYSGGFSVHAARGSARSLCDVDVDPHALAAAGRNLERNPACRGVPREEIRGDAFEVLRALIEARREFDLVVIDPPSFARNRKERPKARSAYTQLASLGARVVAPGGILLLCSCSSQVTPEEFESAALAGIGQRLVRILERRGQPLDHPAAFPEARYLKALYVEIAR